MPEPQTEPRPAAANSTLGLTWGEAVLLRHRMACHVAIHTVLFTERLAVGTIALPFFANLTDQQVARVKNELIGTIAATS